ncbi:MAG: CBS domain-containing protein [Bdellovibrionales bacterium]
MSRLDLPIEEYTTPNPIVAKEDTSVEDLKSIMQVNQIRHLPILRGEKVVGIVSDRDVKIATGLTHPERRQICALDIMVKDPVTVAVDDCLEDVAFQMSEKKIGSVIVNDDDDKFYGIFTSTDALNALIEIARMTSQQTK